MQTEFLTLQVCVCFSIEMLCCPNKVAQWEDEKLQRGWTVEMNAPGSKVLIREGSRERPRSVSYVLHYGKLTAAKVFKVSLGFNCKNEPLPPFWSSSSCFFHLTR